MRQLWRRVLDKVAPYDAGEPLENELTRRLRARFGDAMGETTIDRKQAIVVVNPGRLLDVCGYLRDEEKFDFLTDLTAVDLYDRRPRYDVILNLYSFPKNERLRLKAPNDGACPSGLFEQFHRGPFSNLLARVDQG